jgi:hypothetical protein
LCESSTVCNQIEQQHLAEHAGMNGGWG